MWWISRSMRIFPTFHFCGSRSRDSCAYDFAVGIYRPEKHGMREMKPAIHPNRVGSIEAGGESAQAFGSAPDQSIVLLGYLHNPHRFDEFGHVQQRRLMWLIGQIMTHIRVACPITWR